MRKKWCLDRVVYNEDKFIPNTIQEVELYTLGFCQENVYLRADNTIVLPDFNSQEISGKWSFDGNLLRISQVNIFDFIYNGVFSGMNNLIHQSDQTIIHCFQQNIN